MTKKHNRIFMCMLLCLPLVATTVLADPILNIEVTGGLGIHATIENIGTEPLLQTDFIRCKFTPKFFDQSMPPSFAGNRVDDLNPGDSLSFTWIPPFFRFPAPGVNICTIDVVVYENGNDNTIYGEKVINCLRLGPFILLLSD